MAAIWKRATPPQYRMLRIIAGAVRNAAHAHRHDLPNSFARSVAKRAVGTLTADWPDVLAAKNQRRHEVVRAKLSMPDHRRSDLAQGQSKGDRLGFRRSPIRKAWNEIAMQMWKIKRGGSSEQYLAHVRALQLLDEAQRIIDAAQPECARASRS